MANTPVHKRDNAFGKLLKLVKHAFPLRLPSSRRIPTKPDGRPLSRASSSSFRGYTLPPREYGQCKEEFKHYSQLKPLAPADEANQSLVTACHAEAEEARADAQHVWDRAEKKITARQRQLVDLTHKLETLILTDPRWYQRSDLTTLDLDYLDTLFKLAPIRDAEDFVACLRRIISARLETPWKAETPGPNSHYKLSDYFTTFHEALLNSTDPSSQRHLLHFNIYLKAEMKLVTTRDPGFSYFMRTVDGSIDRPLEQQLFFSVPEDSNSASWTPSLREPIGRPKSMCKDPFPFSCTYMDYVGAHRKIWTMYMQSDVCESGRLGHYEGCACFHQHHIPLLARLVEAAWIEVRHAVDLAMRSRPEVPAELVEAIFDATLEAANLPAMPDVCRKGQPKGEPMMLLPEYQCPRLTYLITQPLKVIDADVDSHNSQPLAHRRTRLTRLPLVARFYR